MSDASKTEGAMEDRLTIMQNAISELCDVYDVPVRFDGKFAHLSDGSREWFFHVLQRPTTLSIYRWLDTDVPVSESERMVLTIQSPAEAISHVHSLRFAIRMHDAVKTLKEQLYAAGGLEQFVIRESDKRKAGYAGLLKKLELSATQLHLHCGSKMRDMSAEKFICLCRNVSIDPKVLRGVLNEI